MRSPAIVATTKKRWALKRAEAGAAAKAEQTDESGLTSPHLRGRCRWVGSISTKAGPRRVLQPAYFLRNVKKTIANSPDESNTNTPGSGASGEDGGRIGPPPPPTGPPPPPTGPPVTAQSDWKASTMLLSSVT